MSTTRHKSHVTGVDTNEVEEVKRKRPFLIFFSVEWWEEIKREHIGSDIHIQTEHEINEVFINGKPFRPTP